MFRSTHDLRALSVVLVLLASSAHAQLKLPGKPREDASGGSVATYRVCSICNARNYTNKPSGRVDSEGRELAWCDACRADTPQTFPNAVSTGPGIPTTSPDGQLRLPRGGTSSAPARTPAPPTVAPAPVLPTAAATAPADGTTAMKPAAAFVYAEVAKLQSPEDGTAQRAVESLLAMGEDGLTASRIALFDEKAAPIVVAARTLLRGAVASDADLVVRRLRAKLPAGVGAPLLRAVVELDPVRATPELFAALLDHTQAPLRSAASRELRARLTETTLALLDAPLTSTRAETRALALELAASLAGTRATAAILTRLDDPNARVASAAVGALRVRVDEGLDMELLRRAFAQRWILRPNAYALLAILEREDAQLRPILLDEHVEPLLASMSSNDPFLSGTCAAALAGLGFKSPRADVSQWLDTQVVDHLVLAVSGKVFHDDHSSLIGPAVRRLRLLSGETYGPDGPAWVDWWLKAREGFRARRASLALQPGEEGALRIRAYAPEQALDVELVGPDAAPRAKSDPVRREEILLTAAQAAELGAALAREGVLAADRMPGAYQSDGRTDRSLDVAVRGRAKSFVVGARAKEPWFEKLLSLAASLRERNHWQLLLAAPAAGADRAAWDAEAAWWAADRTESERTQRLGALALDALRAGPSPRAERALDELDRARAGGHLGAGAFPDLLTALRRETNPGQRAQRVLALTIHAGRGADGAPLAPATAQQIVDVIEQAFGAVAGDLVPRVLAESDRTYVRRLAADEDVVVRRAVASALGQRPDDEDARVLMSLLNDSDPRVHTIAAEALGAAKVELARDDLLSRARLASGSMRRAALRGAGLLGGPHVLDALVLGLADADADVRRAAVEGLGLLRDPSAAQILVNLLQDTGDAPLRETARAALVRIGEPAVPALRRVAEAPDGKARRDAALVLAHVLSPDAAPPLLAIVTQDKDDKHAANELAILSCFDPRGHTANAADAWWEWWDGVRHDDALVWFRAGVERLGIPQPPAGALEGAGNDEGQRFLVSLLDREESWLVERAWRELRRLTGEDLGELPPRGSARTVWMRDQRARIAAREAASGTRR